ncbi:single-stranded DNA-binding protein, mitochondrial [Onthophagus taurus]|uniref:single-stranded DNA-binding protein, mitochondrial n=1 Tax=Onthophagus taurus TaxID=166361 RepID=UPI000C201E89|nr:single-stranded DNA-binding protein, mitochondrial [Onthophagus taurus]
MLAKKLFYLITSKSTTFQKCASLNNVRTKASATMQEPTKVEKTLNAVQLLGRAGGNPQLKGSEQHPMVVFSLATHTNYRYESGEFLQRTEWHRVICFKPGLRDNIMNFLKKGQRVYVNGRITYGEIKGEDGSMKTTTAIQADDIIFFQQPQQ